MPKANDITITKRSDEAEIYRRDQGAIGKAVSGVGLTAANAVDRVTSVVKNPVTSFLGGAAMGLWRGAYWGAIAALFIVAIFPAINIAAAGVTAALICMGTGAAYHAVRGSQKSLDNFQQQNTTRLSDSIAKASHAVPQKSVSLLPKVSAPAYESQETQEQVSFAAREMQRRRQQALTPPLP